MGDEDAKATLIAALNDDTMQRLDNFITMRGGDDLAHLETTAQRLNKVSYQQILSHLKQGNLQDLAHTGAGATMLAGATSALGPKGRKANRVGFSGIAAVQHALAAPLPQVNAAMKWNVDPPAKDKPKSFKWNPDARPRTNAPKTRYPPPPQSQLHPHHHPFHERPVEGI